MFIVGKNKALDDANDQKHKGNKGFERLASTVFFIYTVCKIHHFQSCKYRVEIPWVKGNTN